MGMTGTYIALKEERLEQIIGSSEEDILEIFPGRDEFLDIEKSWMIIHYMLCGTIDGGEPPMGYVVPIREENALDCEMEYGAFFLTAEQVREASDYLCSLDDAALRGMYDYEAMRKKGVYPLFGNEEDPEELFEYLRADLEALREFFQQTVEKGYAVVFYIF